MRRPTAFAAVSSLAALAALAFLLVPVVAVFAAQNLFVLVLLFASRETFGRVVRRWLLAQITLAVLFLPWLSVLAQQVSHVQ
ncbi:MAG TPA: hypothetical protein VEB65_09390, partial [Solirubrobacterales bacterium]|nr:hypothetical protein [Solirubrobacterales bacterium]